MNVDTMRFVDYYVGVPLCFITSVFFKLVRFFQLSRKIKSPVHRVAFIELSEMGSAILADASLRWTQAQNAEVFFVIFKRNVGSLRLLGTVPEKNIFLIRENNLWIFAWDSLRYLIWMRQNRIDAVVDLELFSRYTSLLTAFSGAEKKVGFYAFHNEGLYRGEVLTHKVAYNPHQHIAKNFMALVRSLFSETMDVPLYKGYISEEDIQVAKVGILDVALKRVRSSLSAAHPQLASILEDENQAITECLKKANSKILLFNCAGGEFLPQRRWPVSSYSKLAQTILDKHENIYILLTGSPQEYQEVEPISRLAHRDRLINFAGKILFEDLTALYSVSSLLLSNDSGPAHFASTTSIPTYVFFGPETPKLYGALGNFFPITANLSCSPCVTAFNHRKTPCGDNQCLQVIKHENVYSMICKYFDELQA